MDVSHLLTSATGAFIGFLLGQTVNLVKFLADRITRPRLVIDTSGSNCQILSHSTETANGGFYEEEIYGFEVRNAGRRIATGVKVQLLKIEYREPSSLEFSTVSDHSFNLATYSKIKRTRGDTETVLVPGAAILVELAFWREDHHALIPSVIGVPDYYEEICSGADEYRFTIVTFDDSGRFATKVLTITAA